VDFFVINLNERASNEKFFVASLSHYIEDMLERPWNDAMELRLF
jgi:hypothetical protein